MKAVALGRWSARTVVITALLIIFPAALAAQSGVAPCGCPDVTDLINQLNMATAALNRVDDYLKTVKPTETVNEVAVSTNPTGMTKRMSVDNAIALAIAAVENTKGANSLTVDKDEVTCQSKRSGNTGCMKSMSDFTGALEDALCRIRKQKTPSGTSLSLRDYLTDRKELYSRVIAEILKRLKALPTSCRPGDWMGTLTVSENIRQSTTRGAETTDDTTTRTGTIWMSGISLTPISSWQVGGKYTNSKSGQGVRACTGGLRPSTPDTPYRTSFVMEINKSGRAFLGTRVDVGEADESGKLPIGIMVPRIVVSGDGSATSTRTSGCPNDSFTETTPKISPDYSLDAHQLQSKGDYTKGDPEKISGSDVLTFLNISTSEMTMTHTVTVTYRLYKLAK